MQQTDAFQCMNLLKHMVDFSKVSGITLLFSFFVNVSSMHLLVY